jgi:hypothetical protein
MPALNIRNVPSRLHSLLKKSARESRRSLNGEVLYRLELSFASEKKPARAKSEERRA